MVADTATKLGPEHDGQVVISASHGGLYAAYLAARAGVRGVILNDASVGKDEAGIGGLGYLDDIGLAAATIGHDSARIGDGRDAAARGRISHVNRTALGLGCAPGQSAMDCARIMTAAKPAFKNPPHYIQARCREGCDIPVGLFVQGETDGPEVWDAGRKHHDETGHEVYVDVESASWQQLRDRRSDQHRWRPVTGRLD